MAGQAVKSAAPPASLPRSSTLLPWQKDKADSGVVPGGGPARATWRLTQGPGAGAGNSLVPRRRLRGCRTRQPHPLYTLKKFGYVLQKT